MESQLINIRTDYTLDLKSTFKDVFQDKDLYFTTASEDNCSDTEDYIEHIVVLSGDICHIISIDMLNIRICAFFQCKVQFVTYPVNLHCFALNNYLYLLAHHTSLHNYSMFIIDLTKETINQVNMKTNSFQLVEGYSVAFSETRFLFTGGIDTDGKLSKELYYYDITTYEFGKEKIKSNNLTPRYYHGSLYANGNLYVIGGFVGISKEQRHGSGDIRMIRYEDRELSQWEYVDIKGARPDFLIEPSVQCFDGRYFIMIANLVHCSNLNS